jgi:hypothetical protein
MAGLANTYGGSLTESGQFSRRGGSYNSFHERHIRMAGAKGKARLTASIPSPAFLLLWHYPSFVVNTNNPIIPTSTYLSAG